ncbi:MAG: mechanosensitive ion channel family protein, partial [Sulfuricaulis sp.]
RLRSLSGEQIVFSNADLLKSRIRNYKRMFERRVVFTIGVVYQTAHATLERIPALVRSIVEQQPKTRFDRAHFKEYGDSALVFEVVYFVLDPDYNIYMDIQQAINLAIFRRFQEEAIEFAYPTRTLHVHSSPVDAAAGNRP